MNFRGHFLSTRIHPSKGIFVDILSRIHPNNVHENTPKKGPNVMIYLLLFHCWVIWLVILTLIKCTNLTRFGTFWHFLSIVVLQNCVLAPAPSSSLMMMLSSVSSFEKYLWPGGNKKGFRCENCTFTTKLITRIPALSMAAKVIDY